MNSAYYDSVYPIFRLLTSLKTRCEATKDKMAAFDNNYTSPEEGAKFIFEKVKDIIGSSVSAKATLNKRDLDLASHEVYMAARCMIYVGGGEYLKQLDAALGKGEFCLD